MGCCPEACKLLVQFSHWMHHPCRVTWASLTNEVAWRLYSVSGLPGRLQLIGQGAAEIERGWQALERGRQAVEWACQFGFNAF
eukprot:904205-Pelagomonas_calceolata.AAC.2